MLYAPNGMIIKSSQEHTELAAQFLAAYPNAKWEVLWSISSDIDFKKSLRKTGLQPVLPFRMVREKKQQRFKE